MARKTEKGWDDLEIFTEKGARLGQPYVTITAAYQFIFNAGFIHIGKLMDYSHIILAYSAVKQAITFDFITDEKARGALRLNKGANISLGSRSFFKYYFLDPEKLQGRYRPKREKIPKIGDVWVIYLNEKEPETLSKEL